MDMGLAMLVNQSNSATQSTLLMSNSIISDHTRYLNPYTTLIAIPQECKGIIGGLMTSLNTAPYFDLGERDPKLGGDVTINNHIDLGHTPIGYVAPSAPDFNYHLTANSPAVNSAPSIGLAVDIDGDTRPVGTAPDFGADEMSPRIEVAPTRIDMVIDDTGSQIWAYVEEFHKSNLTWSSRSNAAWVQLNPAGGSTPQLVSVEIDPSKMALGNHSAQIVITSPNAGSATIQLNITRVEKIYRTFQPIILR